MHNDHLSSLKDRLRLQILVMSRVLDVGLDPADVLTSTESPLLQTLNNTTDHIHTKQTGLTASQ